MVARAFRTYLRLRPQLAQAVRDIFEAGSVDAQRHIYDARIRHLLWSRPMNWMLSRQITLSMLGVPHPQRKEVVAQHTDGIAAYIRQAVEYVFRNLPASNNYFWQVYLRGHYTQRCCPEYLKRDNFYRLKSGLVDRVYAQTCTVTEFLRTTRDQISKYVLLDHMDWMSSYDPQGLSEEWNEIMRRAAPQARVIFRSAHAKPRFLRDITMDVNDSKRPLIESMQMHEEWARELTKQDRVHTYAGFHIADLRN
jgi:S-adenosylmethionine-diacylglycerol 3-amino-3-carboxypropyl transferase